MPVIRPSGRSSVVDSLSGRLTEILVKELMGEAVFQGPVVFEEPNGLNGINVFVVWDAWECLAQGDRTSIIRGAYDRYTKALGQSVHFIEPSKQSDLPIVPAVIRATGVTPTEVVENGFLPYSVEPRQGMEAVDEDQAEILMRRAGAIETPSGYQLRLPSHSIAAEIHARLMQEMPEARWSIKDVASIED